MSQYIVKLKDNYLEWSTVSESPTTRGMTREQMRQYLLEKGQREVEAEIEERLMRADAHGSSSIPPQTAEDIVTVNRAGENESQLTLDEIYERCCIPRGGDE